MNSISLNNLWSYLQSLTLTANNKKWLADHLYEAAREETEADRKGKKLEQLNGIPLATSENELPEIVQSLIGIADAVDEDDINGREAYYTHLAQKYA